MSSTDNYALKWRKGSYVARLDGRDDKYGLRRDFVEGRPTKGGGGWLNYRLAAGWYEAREGYKGARIFLAVDTLGRVSKVTSAEVDMARVSEGPNPGEPGAWNSDRCLCGGEVARFDRDGWPTCGDCEETVGESLGHVAGARAMVAAHEAAIEGTAACPW